MIPISELKPLSFYEFLLNAGGKIQVEFKPDCWEDIKSIEHLRKCWANLCNMRVVYSDPDLTAKEMRGNELEAD